MDSFKWQCRKCKTSYLEDGQGLILGTNPSGMKLYSCPCGGIVDLVKADEQLQTVSGQVSAVEE